MHLQYLGHPIANDKAYGGKYLNNAGKEEFTEEDFASFFEDTQEIEGKDKMFLILWLHAYKYTYRELIVKTRVPIWATDKFAIVN